MRLIFVGFGTVGRGAAESLLAARDTFSETGPEPIVVAVVDPLVGNVQRPAGLDLAELLRLADAGHPLTDHPDSQPSSGFSALIAESGADVVVELTPTNLQTGEPGLGHVREALAAGLHVVTTNKGPIALAYRELRDRARASGVELRFEGTVMSGTPVLNLFETGLAGAGVRGLRGVVNGTCNFILSQMERGVAYDAALVDAQQRGYAEADPSGDVDGWDAAAKALILANCVLGAALEIDDVRRSGISDLTLSDIETASTEGEVWRLVARVTRGSEGWEAGVAPERVSRDDALGSLTGPGNLLVVDTESLGEVAIAGPGAGRRATGHAVVADLLALQRSGRG